MEQINAFTFCARNDSHSINTSTPKLATCPGFMKRGQDSSISIETRLHANSGGGGGGSMTGFFLFGAASRPDLEPTKYPIQWVPEALSSKIKRPMRETDHSSHLVPR
jgi:hypothetical protein